MSNTQRHLSRLEKLALRSTHLWLSTKRQKMLPMMPRPAMTGTATPSIQNCRSLFQQRTSQPAVSPVSSASKSSIRRFVGTRAFSWLKAATTAFTFKTLC